MYSLPPVYDPSSGRTVYNTSPQETFSLPQPPSLSPYSVENGKLALTNFLIMFWHYFMSMLVISASHDSYYK